MKYIATVKLFTSDETPTGARGFVLKENDNLFKICISDKLDQDQRDNAIAHEISHIMNNDFKLKSVADIENRTKTRLNNG